MRLFRRIVLSLVLILLAGLALGYTPDTDPAQMRAKYGGGASRFVALRPGLVVHVRDQGPREGQALVLIHGSNASLHSWEPWVARLKDRYRIVTLDLPGHGLTGPNPDGRYNYQAYAALVDQVMQKLGVAHAIVGGNSMGGGVAWTYALAYPEKLDGLVLVDAAGAPSQTPRQMPIGFRLARMPVAKDLARIITPRRMFDASLKTSVYDPAFATPAMVDRYWELNRYPGNRTATMQRFAQAATNRPAQAGDLARIKAPVLILWGAEDNLISRASADWFHAALPGSKLIVYPKTGHLPMEEQPDQSAADLRQWIDARAGAAPAR
ncbi:MAG: alpha/beta fold hydrolase [Chakrabartia sp.]